MYFGYSPGEWQVMGIIGGLLIGAAGLVCNAWIAFHFNEQKLRLMEKQGGYREAD
jgi:hypothetical protein